MRPPRLNRQLVLERRLRVPDGAGGYAEDWSPRGTLWAAMSPRTGRAADAAEARVTKQPWKIVVRGAPVGAPSRPLAGERFREGSRLFGILAVYETDADGRYLTCLAEEERAI